MVSPWPEPDDVRASEKMTSSPRTGLESDYLRLLRSRGLERPSWPLREHVDESSSAYKELADVFGEERLHEAEAVFQEDRTGYNHVLDTMREAGIPASILDSVYLAEYPTGFFNAQVQRTENGFLCLVNQGMRAFLYGMSMAAFYSVVDPDIPETDAETSGSQELRNLERFVYAMGNCWRFVTQRPERASWDGQHHTRAGLVWGARCFGAMRDFVVAHEVAHVALGHVQRGPVGAIQTPSGGIRVVTTDYDQELAADILAQDILTRIAQQHGVGHMCGGLCFLQVYRIISTFRRDALGLREPDAATHPAAEIRFESLFQHVKSRLDTEQVGFLVRLASAFEILRMSMQFVDLKEDGKGVVMRYEEFQEFIARQDAEDR